MGNSLRIMGALPVHSYLGVYIAEWGSLEFLAWRGLH
jgi:hypothetical protein